MEDYNVEYQERRTLHNKLTISPSEKRITLKCANEATDATLGDLDYMVQSLWELGIKLEFTCRGVIDYNESTKTYTYKGYNGKGKAKKLVCSFTMDKEFNLKLIK